MKIDKITRRHVLDAVDKIEKEGIILEPSTRFDVVINGKTYPPKEIMRYANLLANGTKEWPYSGGEPTNKYLKKFDFEIRPKENSVKEIVLTLRKSFPNIWRCADSWRWNEMKDTGLLTFAWLDKKINYSEIDFSDLKSGSRAIYPWVNELSVGDLIFVMGKNTFDGICIAQSEYSFNGPTLALTGYGEKPAIRVRYIYKLENPISHNLETHNNPATFAEIEKYSFGLERIVSFLLENQPSAIDNLMKFINGMTQNRLIQEGLSEINLNTIIYGPPGTGKTYKLNEYKEAYFTDRGIAKSADDVLKEKVSEYPFWKILAAILGDKGNPMSVSEILDSPLLRAKINPDAKTPRNTVWRILQSYADSESTGMNSKYKGPSTLFKKDKDSKWSILDDRKNELADIIDQGLIDLAANPLLPPVQSATIKTRYNFITFHQKYSYEDFIEGIKPLLSNEDAEEQSGELQFELKKGIFYNSCLEALRLVGYDSFEACYQDSAENRIAKFETAKSNPSMQFALFIDEINRANISAVFGELITLLEDDKRIGADNEMWLELPYSNEKFSVPGNLFVIGTMNTADRSIALLDIALRRRFEFKSLYPEYTETEWWASLLEALNQAIYNWKKNPDFFIGHAFFINKPEADRARILNTKIIPLLYEYCQSNAATVKKILSEAGVALKSTGIKENFQIIAE